MVCLHSHQVHYTVIIRKDRLIASSWPHHLVLSGLFARNPHPDQFNSLQSGMRLRISKLRRTRNLNSSGQTYGKIVAKDLSSKAVRYSSGLRLTSIDLSITSPISSEVQFLRVSKCIITNTVVPE